MLLLGVVIVSILADIALVVWWSLTIGRVRHGVSVLLLVLLLVFSISHVAVGMMLRVLRMSSTGMLLLLLIHDDPLPSFKVWIRFFFGSVSVHGPLHGIGTAALSCRCRVSTLLFPTIASLPSFCVGTAVIGGTSFVAIRRRG